MKPSQRHETLITIYKIFIKNKKKKKQHHEHISA